MLREHLERQVIRLLVDDETVYVQPRGFDRLLMLWTFRHFPRISQAALGTAEQARIWRLYRYGQRVHIGAFDEWRIMGTVEQMFTPQPDLNTLRPATVAARAKLLMRNPE